MTSEKQQSIDVQQGEIRFRRMMAQQESGHDILEPDVFSAEEIMPVLAQGIEETRRVFARLQEREVTITPFLELGAERGHRGFYLANALGAEGFVFDLSLDALQFGPRLMAAFDYQAAPVRICGDAYNLPFRSNVFPFVFCFATLHHFPNPRPIVQEAARVIHTGGHFYFDREPTRGYMTVTLWTRRGHKLSPLERVLNRLGILGFISEGGGIEREYGISENTFRLSTWTDLQDMFAGMAMQVNKTLKLRFAPDARTVSHHVAAALGGVTSALCQVDKPEAPVVVQDLFDMLRCPTCRRDDAHLHLSAGGSALLCNQCGMRYPKRQGVFVLIERERLGVLYPDLGATA